ncbi:hypothetical protein L7F22_018551 [Adiantum nelumboides]|nr:hypothetical protein [Adiantum nelumboides]
MQGLSAIRIAHCSFHCSSAAKEELVFLGIQQRSGSSLKFCRKRFTVSQPILKASFQDEGANENAQTPLGEEESSNQAEGMKDDGAPLEEGPKVEVKFVLEKKCHFGQRFNVVGNDPLFGDWEIEAAIPMQWADGDIWTVDVNVPPEKEFEFKFLLTGEDGEVVWQPGSNRLLKTVGVISPLVVNEAWDSVDETAAVEVDELPEDPVKDSSNTSTTDRMQATDDSSGPEDAAKDEIVTALESTDDGTDGHSAPTKSDPDVAPEVPMAELDIVTTAVKSVIGVDGTV